MQIIISILFKIITYLTLTLPLEYNLRLKVNIMINKTLIETGI